MLNTTGYYSIMNIKRYLQWNLDKSKFIGNITHGYEFISVFVATE